MTALARLEHVMLVAEDKVRLRFGNVGIEGFFAQVAGIAGKTRRPPDACLAGPPLPIADPQAEKPITFEICLWLALKMNEELVLKPRTLMGDDGVNLLAIGGNDYFGAPLNLAIEVRSNGAQGGIGRRWAVKAGPYQRHPKPSPEKLSRASRHIVQRNIELRGKSDHELALANAGQVARR